MSATDKDVIAVIQKKYRVTITPANKGVCLEFEGVSEKFHVSTANQELTIFTDTWHEHFNNLEQLLAFLDGLFTGKIQIVVKYRGRTPVGHQSQMLTDGKVNVMSRTGSLVPLFWRPKSFKILKYATANS